MGLTSRPPRPFGLSDDALLAWMLAQTELVECPRPGIGPCKIWTRGKFPNGYGQVTYKGRSYNANRLVMILRGEVKRTDRKRIVFQKCGVRACIAPEHQEVTTRADSIFEHKARGTFPGISETDRDAMILMVRRGISRTETAKAFGVSRQTVHKYTRGITPDASVWAS